MNKLANNPVFCKKTKKQLAQMGFTFHKMYAANYPTMWYTVKGKSLIVWLKEKDITLAGHGFGSEFTKSFLELPIGCYNINIETGEYLAKATPFDYVDGFSEHWITETQKQLLQILNQIT